MFVKVHKYSGGAKSLNVGSSSAMMEYLDKENKELQAEIEQLKYEQSLEGYSDEDILDILTEQIEENEKVDILSLSSEDEKREFEQLFADQKELKSLIEDKNYFYNSDGKFSVQEAKVLIDSGNERLKASESKYFMFTSNPSSKEIEHLEGIIKKDFLDKEKADIIGSRRRQELTESEKGIIEKRFEEFKESKEFDKVLDSHIKDYSNDLIKVYAEAFTRRDKDGELIKIEEKDLNWIAKNETERRFKHWENPVKDNKEILKNISDIKADQYIQEDKLKDSQNKLARYNFEKTIEGKRQVLKEVLKIENTTLINKDKYASQIEKASESKLDSIYSKLEKEFKNELKNNDRVTEKEIDELRSGLYRQNDKGVIEKGGEGDIIKTDLLKAGKNNHTHFVVSKQTKTKWYKGERCKTTTDKTIDGLKNKKLWINDVKQNALVSELKKGSVKLELTDDKGRDIGREIEFKNLVEKIRTNKVKEVLLLHKDGKEIGILEQDKKLLEEFKNKNIQKSSLNEYKGSDKDVAKTVELLKSGELKLKILDKNGDEIKVNSEFEKLSESIQNDKLIIKGKGVEPKTIEGFKNSVKGGEVKLDAGLKEDDSKEWNNVVKDLKEGKSKSYNNEFKKVDGRGMSLSPNANSKGTSKEHQLNGKSVSVGFNHEKFKTEAGKLFQEKFNYKANEKEQYKGKSSTKSSKIGGLAKGKINSKIKGTLKKELLQGHFNDEQKALSTVVKVVKAPLKLAKVHPVILVKDILKGIAKEILKGL